MKKFELDRIEDLVCEIVSLLDTNLEMDNLKLVALLQASTVIRKQQTKKEKKENGIKGVQSV